MHAEKKPNSTSSPLGDLEPPILSEKKQTDNEELRQLAYHLWQQRGSPTDSSEEDCVPRRDNGHRKLRSRCEGPKV